jgi:Region found in RelA / SpoT proteins
MNTIKPIQDEFAILEQEEFLASWVNEMDFEVPQFSRGVIDKAGEVVAQEGGDPPFTLESAHAMLVVGNWRASHSYPMQIIRNNLANRAKKVSSAAVVAQRLKRFESIVSKLEREPRMKLSQMQDLGGCRAIMPNIAGVDELVRLHKEAWDKAPSRHELHRCKDYIAEPKPSGYRGVHLIYKFKTDNPDHSAHNGQRIEVQIRSRLQHAWATAVEVVGAFRAQALKSGQGSAEWQRLFALMGSVIARKEGRALVPNTPEESVLLQEIKSVSDEIKAEQFLAGCSEAAVHIEKSTKPAVAYLIVLDVKDRRVTILAQDSMLVANEKYAQMEKENKDQPELQTVLVSVDSLGALKTAYPNYYLDVSEFLQELRNVIGPFRIVLGKS